MSDKSVEFKNPDNLPVENVVLTVSNAGVVRQIKALDPYWVEKREFIKYERPLPSGCLVMGAVEAWLVRMQGFLEDVKWLLRLEHYRFWSTIVHDPQCMDALVSFLQEANPPYLPPHESAEVEKLYGEIRRYVLIVFCRLITNKESKACWMTKEFMADLIYDNFIFTIPILWDICLVYGVDNSQHVSRMLNSVFTLQPKYDRDATAAVAFVNEAFKYIILQVNKHYDSEEPPNLPETFKGFSEIRRPTDKKIPDKMTFEMLRDLVIHLLDTTMTLRIFIQAYPKSVDVFRKTNFVNSIVQLYEYGIPPLYEKLQELGEECSVTYSQTEEYIETARAEIIDTLREILAVYKNKLFSGEGNIATHVEDYLTVMMDGLSEKLLIQDYHACYPVNEDIELLRQAYPGIDTVKTDFILQAIYSNMDEPIPDHLLNGFSNGDAFQSTNHEPRPSSSSQSQRAISTNIQSQATDDIPDNLKRESLISEVRDIFPHLGDGFILKCLEHYGFNSERVINSILEDNLAEPLKALDQSMPIIPEDPLDKKFLETGISRLNVFDGDEFDIMTRDDVDTSRIHVGKKKGKYRDLQDMLDDKSDVKKLADVYSKYNMVYDEVEAGMYSDEYDDTYDSDGVTPAGDGEEPRRPFVTPRVLGLGLGKRQEESQQETESSGEDDSTAITDSNKTRMDFCVNPEEVRARREAAWQARRGKGHRPPPAKNLDVAGKPKGQGQEKEVLVNRDKKEKHKSARGNHSRRQGAQWKRSQGMMPS